MFAEETHRPKVAHSNSNSDGQGDGSALVRPARVDTGVHREDQDEGDHELNAERLTHRHPVRQLWSAQGALVQGVRGRVLQNQGPNNGSSALADDVQNKPDDGNPAAEEQAERHCRVDVSTADVGRDPDSRGDTEGESQGDLDGGGAACSLTRGRESRTTAHQNEQHRPEKLRQQSRVKLLRRDVFKTTTSFSRHCQICPFLPKCKPETDL